MSSIWSRGFKQGLGRRHKVSGTKAAAIPSFSFLECITCDAIKQSKIQLEIIEIMKIAIFSVLAFIALALAVVPPQKAVIISMICPDPFVSIPWHLTRFYLRATLKRIALEQNTLANSRNSG